MKNILVIRIQTEIEYTELAFKNTEFNMSRLTDSDIFSPLFFPVIVPNMYLEVVFGRTRLA